MVNKFAEASSHELEVLLESLFENTVKTPAAIPGVYFARDPILGNLFIANEDHSALRLLVCRALVADAKFRNEAPGWPHLPLRQEDIKEMIDDDCPRCSIVGLFGSSWRQESWSPLHPMFAPFVSGLLACRSTPRHLRTDPELLRQFPPHRLAGMCAKELAWHSPETRKLDRKMRRMIKAHEDAQMGA